MTLPSLAFVLPSYAKAALDSDSAFASCLSLSSSQAAASPGLDCKHDIATTTHLDGSVLVLDNVLSSAECALLTAAVDSSSSLSFWSPAGRENEEARAFRNADTIEMSAHTIASELWTRTCKQLRLARPGITIPEDEDEGDPDTWERELPGTWSPAGYNHDLLFAKYQSGGSFAPHTDGRAIHDFNRRSFESVIIFLNDIPQGCGGGTRFYKKDALQSLKLDTNSEIKRWTSDSSLVTLEVAPRAGRALIFDQALVHEGVPPEDPHSKFIIRSDIMYDRETPICCQPADLEAYRIFRQGEFLAEEGKVDESLVQFQKAWRLSPTLARIQGQR